MQKVLFIIGVCGFGTFVYWQSTKSNLVMDDLLLKNVEALANDENSGSALPVSCVMYGETKCPHDGVKVKYVVEGYSLHEDEETY